MKHGVCRRFVFFGVLCRPRPSTSDGVATSFFRAAAKSVNNETQFLLTALARADRRNTKQHIAEQILPRVFGKGGWWRSFVLNSILLN